MSENIQDRRKRLARERKRRQGNMNITKTAKGEERDARQMAANRRQHKQTNNMKEDSDRLRQHKGEEKSVGNEQTRQL